MASPLGFHLEPIQLERLKEHKYKSQGTSLFEVSDQVHRIDRQSFCISLSRTHFLSILNAQPVMQVFWKWLVTKVPMWLAPNLITFIGLVINILTTLPVILLDYNVEGSVRLKLMKVKVERSIEGRRIICLLSPSPPLPSPGAIVELSMLCCWILHLPNAGRH